MRVLLSLFIAMSFISAPVFADDPDTIDTFKNTTWSVTDDEEGSVTLIFKETTAILKLTGFDLTFQTFEFQKATDDSPAMIFLKSDLFGTFKVEIQKDGEETYLQFVGEDAPDVRLNKITAEEEAELKPIGGYSMAIAPFYRSLKELNGIVELLKNGDVEEKWGTPGTIDSIVRDEDGNYKLKAGTRSVTIKKVTNEPKPGLAGPTGFTLVVGRAYGKKSNLPVKYRISINEIKEVVAVLNENDAYEKLDTATAIVSIIRIDEDNYEATAGGNVLSIPRVGVPVPGFPGERQYKFVVGDVNPLDK